MNNLLSYSGINAKIKAMSANLIKKEEFERIASINTTSDLIAFLKNHPGYRNVFKQYDEHELHRYDAERIIGSVFYDDFARIYRFADDAQKKDLDLLFFRYEVTILKACIRHIHNRKNMYELSLLRDFFGRHSKLDISALMSSYTMEEFISKLEGTHYYPVLSSLPGDKKSLPHEYELKMDIFYFTKAWKLKDKLVRGNNLKAVTDILGTRIDLMNIMWAYRLKALYRSEPSDILARMIPVNYKLSKEALLKLINSSSPEEFMSLLAGTPYGDFSAHLTDGSMEAYYDIKIMRISRDNIKKYPASMSRVNYYLYCRETEIGRLTTALECIRYKLEPAERLKYIFGSSYTGK